MRQRAGKRLRSEIQRWRQRQAAERIASWRLDPAALTAQQLARAHGWLASSAAQEAIGEAEADGEFDAMTAGAVARQLADARREHVFAPVRDAWQQAQRAPLVMEGNLLHVSSVLHELMEGEESRRPRLARALNELLLEHAARTYDAWQRAHAVAAGLVLEAAPREALRGFLTATQDAADDAVTWLLRSSGPVQPRDWQTLWRANIATMGSVAKSGIGTGNARWRNVATRFAGLGMSDVLIERLRVEHRQDGVWPGVEIAMPAVPGDVRLGVISHAPTGVTERTAVEATGRALCAGLSSSVLPVEQRWPVADSSMGWAMGVLLGQWLADPLYWERSERMTATDADRAARVHAASLLLEVRLSCAAALHLPQPTGDGFRYWQEQAVAGLMEATRVVVTQGLASLLGLGTGPGCARGRLGGLALHLALRDKFDEDWYRNPRAGDVFRGAGARGEALTVEDWCSEQGVGLQDACRRIGEIWRG